MPRKIRKPVGAKAPRHRNRPPTPDTPRPDGVPEASDRHRPGPPVPGQWRDAFIEELRDHAGMYRAARRVGINPRTVYDVMERDPAFADAVKIAREECADGYQAEMIDQARDTGNPTGYIVRLKALRPSEYIEKHAVLNVTADVQLGSEDAMSLIRSLIDTARPHTLSSLKPHHEPEPLPAYQPDVAVPHAVSPGPVVLGATLPDPNSPGEAAGTEA
jgi:hypothetical protein